MPPRRGRLSSRPTSGCPGSVPEQRDAASPSGTPEIEDAVVRQPFERGAHPLGRLPCRGRLARAASSTAKSERRRHYPTNNPLHRQSCRLVFIMSPPRLEVLAPLFRTKKAPRRFSASGRACRPQSVVSPRRDSSAARDPSLSNETRAKPALRPWRCFAPSPVRDPPARSHRVSHESQNLGSTTRLPSALRFRCAGAGRRRPRGQAHRPTVCVGRGGPEFVRLLGSHAVRRISRSASSCHAAQSSSRQLAMPRAGDCSAAICCSSRPTPVGRRSPTSDSTRATA